MLAKYIVVLASAVSVMALPNWAPTTTSSVAKPTTTSAVKPTTSAVKPTTSSVAKPTTTSAQTTSTKASASPSSTPINNGNQFTNQCVNVGVSIADCTELLNIAGMSSVPRSRDMMKLTSWTALNGNTVIVGGSGSSSTTPVNNGQQFLNQCANFGISILDCSELINLVSAIDWTDLWEVDVSTLTLFSGSIERQHHRH